MRPLLLLIASLFCVAAAALRADLARWEKVVKQAGIRIE